MTNLDNGLGLDDYVRIIGRRWILMLATLVVVVGAAVAFTVTTDEVFESEADVLLMTESTTGLFSFGSSIEDRLARNPVSELQLADSLPFRTSAESTLSFESDVSLDLVPPPGSEDIQDSSVLRFTAQDSEPERARRAAQVYADDYVRLRAESDLDAARSSRESAAELLDELTTRRAEVQAPIALLRSQRQASDDPVLTEELDRQIAELEVDSRGAIESLDAQITEVSREAVLLDQTISSLSDGTSAARILNAAPVPESPVSPDLTRNIIVAIVVGLLLGLLLVTLRELFSSTPRRAEEG